MSSTIKSLQDRLNEDVRYCELMRDCGSAAIECCIPGGDYTEYDALCYQREIRYGEVKRLWEAGK